MAQQSTRTDMLVDEFQAACSELRDAILEVPDERWQSPTPGDGRQVNVVAHHAASAHGAIAEMVQAMADGREPTIGMDQIHAGNAEHARRFGGCSKAPLG
jgi:phytoene/squalene synthetase